MWLRTFRGRPLAALSRSTLLCPHPLFVPYGGSLGWHSGTLFPLLGLDRHRL